MGSGGSLSLRNKDLDAMPSTVTEDPVNEREEGIYVVPPVQHNVTSDLSLLTALLYSNVMRTTITGSSNNLQVIESERALAEEIRKEYTRFVTQVSEHLGCHDRSKAKLRMN